MRDRDKPLDVWLLFDEDEDGNEDEEPSHEANVFLTDDFRFDVQWYHTAVGLVSHEAFDTYAEAQSWLERSGYQDFSSGDVDDDEYVAAVAIDGVVIAQSRRIDLESPLAQACDETPQQLIELIEGERT